MIGVFYYSPSHLLTTTAIAVFPGLLFVLLGHILYLYLIVRPGKTLLQLQADIEGLNMYISLAEEKQMQYFNPPKVTQKC